MFSLTPSSYGNTIIIPVAVLPPPPATEIDPQLVCPIFIVPAGDWTLVWNLVTLCDPGSPHAVFDPTTGIQALLGAHHKLKPSKQITGTQWAASIHASCETRVEPFSYVVRFLYPAPPANAVLYSSMDRKVISHDPTIVIAHDPIGSRPT